MSRRNHTLYNAALINGNEYLRQNIRECLEDPHCFKCLACEHKLKVKKSMYFENLQGHLQSKTHAENSIKFKLQLTEALGYLEKHKRKDDTEYSQDSHSYQESRPPGSCSISKQQTIELEPSLSESVANELVYRLKVTELILENNLPFSLADKLQAFIKDVSGLFSFDILKTFAVDRKNVTTLANTCILPHVRDRYFKILQSAPFFISLDSGTAKGNVEYLAVNVCFFED